MRYESTSGWSWEQLEPYGPAITKMLHKLSARFPKDTNPEAIAKDCLSGALQLWLIFDDDKFVSIVLTRVQTNSVGVRSVAVTSMAGEDGLDTVPLMADLEEWARDEGAEEITVTGRLGWKKALAQHGYKLDFAYYRKDIS